MSSRTAVWAGALSDDTKNGCVADYPYAAIFTDQKSWLKTQKTIWARGRKYIYARKHKLYGPVI